MKKVLILALCLVLSLSSVPAALADSLPEYTGSIVKLSEEPVTLSMFVRFDSSRYTTVSNYGELPCQTEMERLTNVKINYIHPATGSESEQLNLILSSGVSALPDIIFYNWQKVSTTPDQMYENGLIYDCKELIEKYAVNYRTLITNDPSIKKDTTTDSGLMPGFYLMQFSDVLKNTYAYMLRADWLEKVQKDVPVTLDDWYDVLCAFRDNDMDGDGDPGNEIPLSSGMFTGLEDCMALENFYTAWGKTWKMYIGEDGHAAYGAYDQDYKEYLLLMHKWFEEGLIDPDFVSNDKTQQDGKFLNGQAGALRSGLGAGMGAFIKAFNDENIIAVALNPVQAAGDVSYNFGGLSAGVTPSCAVITKHCQNPELAVKYLDMLYAGDGMMLCQYGIEGESYHMVDGYPVLSDYIMKNPDGKSVNLALSEFSLGACSYFPMWNDSAVREQRMLTYSSQREAGLAMSAMDTSRVIHNISLTADETMEYSGLISEIETYVKEATLAFILGEADIEDGFEDYMSTLRDLGVEEAIAIQDAALQRYNQR